MLAAAVSSIWRAAAPISRMGCRKWRRLREPSVFCPPYVASSPRAWAILTRDQSASSSSATAIGSAVRTPWPISDRCATMVTSPVSSMDTNAVGLKRGTSTAGAAGGLLANPRRRRRSPITRPPATAAPPTRKLRRLRFSRIAAISCPSCRGLDRRTNPLIGAAATDVASHRLVDIVIGGLRGLGEQAGCLHDLPTLAVAALRDVQAAPRGLDVLADRCSADPLDGRDLLAFRSRDRRDARARRRTIQVHRARAAEGHATPELGAGESELVAQRPEQWRARRHVHRHGFAIDVESGHTGFTPSNRSLTSDQRVHRPYPGAVEDQRDRQREPHYERNDAAVGLEEPSKHQDASRAGGAMNSGPTGSVIASARMRSMSARASSSRFQPSTSSIGAS